MNEQEPVRVGVVGAGFSGRYHAQQYSSLPGATLVGIADHDATSAARLAAEFGGESFADHRSLVGLVDAVSVATPTVSHFAVAEAFLKRGISVLVEKPMAATIDEARSLVRLAGQTDAVLQVGHVERFNPTWQAFEESPFRPTFIQTRRSSPYPFRSLDVSVVFDVMIHDIDLALRRSRFTGDIRRCDGVSLRLAELRSGGGVPHVRKRLPLAPFREPGASRHRAHREALQRSRKS